MTLLAAQFLESVPPGLTPQQARDCLRRAFDLLPLSHILLGWDMPHAIESVVAEETARRGAQLYQWHPLLTGERHTPPEWRTVNLLGQAIPGHLNLPEFTFICPNHPAAQHFVIDRVEQVLRRGVYKGLFLDRIRFPSPAISPEQALGCFCEHCRAAASAASVDLEAARRQIGEMMAQPGGRQTLVRSLFDPGAAPGSALAAFLRFRAGTVTRSVGEIAQRLGSAGMQTGLDCFSPSLAWMVGQDLGALNAISAWTKLMIYPHAFGPAGLPFELLGLLDWLGAGQQDDEMSVLRACSGLDLPVDRAVLASTGLPAAAIQAEIALGKQMGVTTLLAGLALVDLPGINAAHPDDLPASLGADGIVLSWDLWHIAPDVLHRLAGLLKEA